MGEVAADQDFMDALSYLLHARILEAGGEGVKDETREITIKNYRARWNELWANETRVR